MKKNADLDLWFVNELDLWSCFLSAMYKTWDCNLAN